MILCLTKTMRRASAALLAALVASGGPMVQNALAAQAQSPAAVANLEGHWRGVLKIPGGPSLTLALNITRGADGQLSGTLDSPDQGAMGIRASAVTLTGQKLRVEVARIAGVFEGTLQPAGDMLVGEWRQGLGVLPLTFERHSAPIVPKRPQEPQQPYPYLVEEVSYQNAKAGVTLAGTLTRPKDARPAPAVLLLTGSGPQDRDEALMGHRPFLVLADYLTRQGFAVLRVDDRGVGGSTGSFATSSMWDFVEDAIAGVEYLKTRQGIDPARIGLLGHSEGGSVAPLVATKTQGVSFLVLLAGPGVTGEEILYAQGALIARAQGATEQQIQEMRAAQESLFTVLKAEPDAAAAEAKLRAVLQAQKSEVSEAERAGREAQLKTMLRPWFRALLIYDPKPALRAVTCPVLAINGEKDLQVPWKENLTAIETALKAGGNKDVTIQMLPGLNHLFQTSTTGSPAEYAKIEETMAPAALQTIADWLRPRTMR